MLKRIRPGVILAIGSVLTLVTGGVAVAAPLTQVKETANDYRLTLSIDDVNIQSVPNMAAAPLVREGFVTATVNFKAECIRKQQPCETDQFKPSMITWAQLGCSVQLGDDGIFLQPGANFLAGLPGTLGGLLPEGGDVTRIGITPSVNNVTPGPFTVTLKPGYITDMEIGKKASDFSRGMDKPAAQETEMSVSVTNRHVLVDQTKSVDHSFTCMGPVAIRIRAQGTLRTPTSIDTVDIFGPLYTL